MSIYHDANGNMYPESLEYADDLQREWNAECYEEEHEDDETEENDCALCGQSCVDNSTCLDRYNICALVCITPEPARISSVFPPACWFGDSLAVCDRCYGRFDLSKTQTIKKGSYRVTLECDSIRVNAD